MPAVLVFLLTLVAPPVAQDDSYEERIAQQLAHRTIVNFLTEHEELEFESEQAKGVASAIEPEENVEVEIDELHVTAGTALVKLKLMAPFAFEGQVELDDDEDDDFTDVSGAADLVIEMRFTANFSEQGDRIQVRAKAEEIECEVDEIRETDPPELPGAKELVEEIFRDYSEELREKINDWLDDQTSL